MRKIILLFMSVWMLLAICGCNSSGDVKIYTSSEETVVAHVKNDITAIITDINLKTNKVSFIDCMTGDSIELIYHGGVSVINTYGTDIGINGVGNGSVVDVCYYSDTNKIVSIELNKSTTRVESVKKFSADIENNTAKYKGTSCSMWEHVVAFDGDKIISVMEINTEDQVTLTMYGGKLVAVNLELGHGYVRLINHDTYIGGLVEIGYDVIVPVTSDMLVAVGEGDYTLRIHNDSYSDSKPIKVTRDKEITVDLYDIAIPTGTVTFNITPADATLYVNGNEQEAHIYTNLYGSYGIRVTKEGFSTFNGSFNISRPTNSFDIKLVELEDEKTTETTTEATTESATTEKSESNSHISNATSTDSIDTEKNTGNKITVNAPVGAGVYVDGEYVGVAPVSFPKVVGSHTITLYKPGYLIKSYTVQAADDGGDDQHSFPDLTSVLGGN